MKQSILITGVTGFLGRHLLEKIDAESFYRITGHRASASYSVQKLMWLRDHEPDERSVERDRRGGLDRDQAIFRSD